MGVATGGNGAVRGAASPQAMWKRVMSVAMSVVMAVSLAPLPGYSAQAYAEGDGNLAAGEALASGGAFDAGSFGGTPATQADGDAEADAEADADADAEAYIGGTPYQSLKDALAAASSNQEVRVAKDIDVSSLSNIEGKTGLVIDLGTHTVNFTANNVHIDQNSEVTIRNGTIDVSGNAAPADCVIGVGAYNTSENTLTLEGVTLTGKGYNSSYAVLYAYGNGQNTLNLDKCTVELTEETSAAGGAFKGGNVAKNKVYIKDSTIELNKASRGFTTCDVKIYSSNVGIKECDNGFNGSAVTIVDSDVSVTDGTGRGITAGANPVVIKGTSHVTLSGDAEGDLRLDGGSSVSVKDTASLSSETIVENGSSAGAALAVAATASGPRCAVSTPEKSKVFTICATLEEAMGAVADGGEVKMLANDDGADAIVTGKSVTLDVGGYSVADAISVADDGVLAIKGSGVFASYPGKQGTGRLAIGGAYFPSAVSEGDCAEGFIPVPTAVSGKGYTVQAGEIVARIGDATNGVGYGSLNAALTAASDGDTVYIVGDEATWSLATYYMYTLNKNITLCTVLSSGAKVEATGGSIFAIAKGKTLTLAGGVELEYNGEFVVNGAVALDADSKIAVDSFENNGTLYVDVDGLSLDSPNAMHPVVSLPEKDDEWGTLTVPTMGAVELVHNDKGYAAGIYPDGNIVVGKAVARVENGGVDSSFCLFANAVATVDTLDGESTITLLEDADLSTSEFAYSYYDEEADMEMSEICEDVGVMIADDRIVVLNLNGHDIIGNVAGSMIENRGTLTINGEGHVYNKNVDRFSYHAVVNRGTITINGGTYGDADDDMTNDNGFQRGDALYNYGTATVNGGRFTAVNFNANQNVWAYAISNDGQGVMIINDATVYGKTNGLVWNGGSGSVLTIKDGSFTLSASPTATYNYQVVGAGATSTTYITGGTFKHESVGGEAPYALRTLNASKIYVSGGDFTYNKTIWGNWSHADSEFVAIGGIFDKDDVKAKIPTGLYDDPATEAADGKFYTCKTLDNGRYKVVENTSVVAYLGEGTSAVPYTSFASAAFARSGDDAVVTLYADVPDTDAFTLTSAGKTLKVNENGKVLGEGSVKAADGCVVRHSAEGGVTTYRAVQAAVITWKNHDGTTLAADTIAVGEAPVYSGETPVKAGDSTTSYRWVGWNDGSQVHAPAAALPAATAAGATYTAEFEPAESVARVGTAYYASLADALAAAKDGDTVTMVKEESLAGPVAVDKAIELDLNGQAVKNADGQAPECLIDVRAGASLTVEDSSEGRSGSIANGASGGAAIANAGALSVASGSIVSASDGHDVVNSGVARVSGGAFSKPLTDIAGVSYGPGLAASAAQEGEDGGTYYTALPAIIVVFADEGGNAWGASVPFAGAEQKPFVIVMDAQSNRLAEGEDYEVSYNGADFTNVTGEAVKPEVTVAVKDGSSYGGSRSMEYEITPAPMSSATVSVEPDSVTYDGTAHKIAPTVTLDGNVVDPGDYDVSYKRLAATTSDYTSAGTVTVEVAGTGNLVGSKTASYRITKAVVDSLALEAYTADAGTVVTAAALQGVATVKAGALTLGGSDYALVIRDKEGEKVESASAAGTYTVEVVPTEDGNFTVPPAGVSAVFVIAGAPSNSAADGVPIGARAPIAVPTARRGLVYSGRAKTGVSAAGCIISGNVATGAGNYTAVVAPDSNHRWAGRTGAAATAPVRVPWSIAPRKVTKISSIKDVVFKKRGKVNKTALVVKAGAKKLSAGKDYKVTYRYARSIGKAFAVVKGVGNYTGTLKKAYRILPRPTSIRRLYSEEPGAMTVRWYRRLANEAGYQIQFDTDRQFHSGASKIVSVGDKRIRAHTVEGLEGGTKYYVRVRTVKKVGLTTYRSKWSSVNVVRVL